MNNIVKELYKDILESKHEDPNYRCLVVVNPKIRQEVLNQISVIKVNRKVIVENKSEWGTTFSINNGGTLSVVTAEGHNWHFYHSGLNYTTIIMDWMFNVDLTSYENLSNVDFGTGVLYMISRLRAPIDSEINTRFIIC